MLEILRSGLLSSGLATERFEHSCAQPAGRHTWRRGQFRHGRIAPQEFRALRVEGYDVELLT